MHDFGINMEKLNLMKEFLSVQGRKLLIQISICTIIIIGMFINSIYLDLSFEKITISFLLTCLIFSEVLADLFAGYFQTAEKLFIAGQSYLFRVIGYDIIFFIVIILTKNLELSLLGAIIFSFILNFRRMCAKSKRAHSENL